VKQEFQYTIEPRLFDLVAENFLVESLATQHSFNSQSVLL